MTRLITHIRVMGMLDTLFEIVPTAWYMCLRIPFE